MRFDILLASFAGASVVSAGPLAQPNGGGDGGDNQCPLEKPVATCCNSDGGLLGGLLSGCLVGVVAGNCNQQAYCCKSGSTSGVSARQHF